MGAHASGNAFAELSEPLLSVRCHQAASVRSVGKASAEVPDSSDPPASYSTASQPSAPASFKACKHRKTKDFIGSEIIRHRSISEIHADVDPRLVNEADTTHAISAKVATLIFQYVTEGSLREEVACQDESDDAFHELHFIQQRRCCCFPRRVRRPSLSVENIFGLINDISDSLYFCKQVVVLCAIYIERLIQRTSTRLTDNNWRSLVVVALLVASKVWEDVHPWNADFEECLQEVAGIEYKQGALFQLERIFLEKLCWKVFVDGECYAAYFFALLDERRDDFHNRRLSYRSRHYSDFAIQTIIEEDSHAGSDSDMEGLMFSPEDGERRISGASHITYKHTDSASSANSRLPSPLPWSRDDLVVMLRQQTLDTLPEGNQCPDSNRTTLRAIRDCWRLDARNPHVGSLRHAPRALAPSRHIPQSEELLWANELAAKTTGLLGHQHRKDCSYDAAHTLSGATGSQLASELRHYLSATSSDGKNQNVHRPSILEEMEAGTWSDDQTAA
eukprot:TRINITY_DN90767_c0_g1_i1.p1 TRINITY_DN90767_c0_g1~~TRINITY_DN90767_c0_g1_i1.p1  ORF type:complete len:514 (+),score=72.96 TRINITY_DN90767_c0_g1_i1:29-1543(+)